MQGRSSEPQARRIPAQDRRVRGTCSGPGSTRIADHLFFSQHAKIDVDIYQIGVVMYMGSTDAAKDVFEYRANSVYMDVSGGELYRTLDYFATDNRTGDPNYAKFVDYYDEDENYAKFLIADTFEGEGTTLAINEGRANYVTSRRLCQTW